MSLLESNLTAANILDPNCELYLNTTIRGKFCDVIFDGIQCWPKTPVNTTRFISCFKKLNGIIYDNTKEASRHCFLDGTWANQSNYNKCIALNESLKKEEELLKNLSEVNITSFIYFFGYGFSMMACIMAFLIFTYFLPSHEAKCLRIKIHKSLIITYILTDFFWIMFYKNIMLSENGRCYLFIVLNYLLTTSYFWMFVEGLHIVLLLTKPLAPDSRDYIFYNIIGWGLPFIFILIWGPLKYLYGQLDDNIPECRFVKRDIFDYIFITPILIVLLFNVFFIVIIVYILYTKIGIPKTSQVSNPNDTSKDHWKSAKSMLILIPLLGVNYWFLLVPPDEKTAKLIILYLRAFLFSFQGLVVTIIYCFTNTEVKKALNNSINKYNEMRKFKSRPNKTKGSASSGSTLLNSTVTDTLYSNDAKTALLDGNQQLQDFKIPINSSANIKNNFGMIFNTD